MNRIVCFVAFFIMLLTFIIALNKDRESFHQITRISTQKLIDTPNPWDKTAQIMGSMQLSSSCRDLMDKYGKEPSEENFAQLLNCTSHPGESYYIRQLLSVLKSGVMS